MRAVMPDLILASRSQSRRNMLQAVGLPFTAMPADIRENDITLSLQGEGKPAREIAQALADEKALSISETMPASLVIGSDQVLECEGQLLSKAKDPEQAKDKLRFLRGREHHLISALCVAKEGRILWQKFDKASLLMHDFDDDFLDHYCARAGESLTRSVGAYEIEGAGAWLFKSVSGDIYTIMGMPLLPLLSYLRKEYGSVP